MSHQRHDQGHEQGHELGHEPASLDSAALLRKYVQLRTEGVRDALAPHHVLGLPAGVSNEATVLRALRERLELVSRVPAGSDAEVSHVRMLLHASAAVMLSEGSGLGAGVGGRTGGGVGSGIGSAGAMGTEVLELADGPVERPMQSAPMQSAASHARQGDALAYAGREVVAGRAVQASVPSGNAVGLTAFDEAMRITLGLHGGWNQRTMHHARLLAMSHGVGVHELVASLRRLSGGGAALGGARAAMPTQAVMRGPVVAGVRQAVPSVVSRAMPQASVQAGPQGGPQGGPQFGAQSDSPRMRERGDEAATVDAYAMSEPDPNGAVKRLLGGAALGAALLLVVALTLRYTVGRTPPAGGGAGAGNAASAAGQAGARGTGDGGGQLPAGRDVTQGAGSGGNDAQTGEADAGQASAREGGAGERSAARSMQELLAALQQAAQRGGVQRVSASVQQPDGSAGVDPAKPPTNPRDLDGSLTVFRDAMDELGQRWVSASEQQLLALSSAVVEYIYRVGDSEEHARAAVELVAQPARSVLVEGQLRMPEDVRSAVLSAGLLARLRSERDLAWGTLERIMRASDAVFGVVGEPAKDGRLGLLAGSESALRAMPARLAGMGTGTGAGAGFGRVSVPEAQGLWEAWRESARALAAGDEARLGQHALGAIDTVLSSGQSPAQQPMVLMGYRVLVPVAGFGASATKDQASVASRQRLLGWLASPGVGPEQVSVIVSSLIEGKLAGVDLSMSLTAGASESDRALLRERLAALWDMAAGEDAATEVIERWRGIAGSKREGLIEGATRTQAVMRLVEAASLNTLAWQIVLGDIEVARAGLGETGTASLPEAAIAPMNIARLTVIVESGAWGERYVLAGANATKRLEALRSAGGVSNLLEARILVQETMRGATPELRGRARSLTEANAENTMVLSAMLDASASAPPVAELVPFYERLSGVKIGSVRDPGWRVRLRQGVMQRLIQRIAQGANEDVRDIATGQRVLGGIYEQRGFALDNWRRLGTGLPPSVMPVRADDADPTELSEKLVGNIAGYVRTLYVPVVGGGGGAPSPEETLALQEQRLRVARGRPQQFVARQMAMLELQASVAIARAPAEAARVRSVLEGARRDVARRDADRADRVLTQMVTLEQAMLELWWIALGGGA